jgi:Cys-tRNA(Pro) deacylase
VSLGEQQLRELGVAFATHEYDYRKKGAEAAAEALGVPLSAALKTLVVRLSDDRDVFVLVAGDRSVSMRNLARALGVKSASLASERDTERLTGYRVGGIGPFGSRTKLPVFVDLAALDHDQVYVNGGRRGLLLSMEPEVLIEACGAELIDASNTK